MCQLTRRGFLVGCSAAVAAFAGSRFSTLAFADPGENSEVLVVIFLRGGVDGLSIVVPLGGADRGFYEAARPNLAIPASGPGAALPLTGQFGLHPAASPIHGLYQAGKIAIVQAVGLPFVNRSHFEAMQYLELGTPGDRSTLDGWLTRHLASAGNLPPSMILPSLALGALQPASLRTNLETINMVSADFFDIDTGPPAWRDAQRTALRSIYGLDTTWLHAGGLQAMDAIDVVQTYAGGPYVPSNGAVYPESDFGDQLQVVAQIVKADLGLQLATLDVGGWDTHEGQGEGSTGYLADLLADLTAGLEALYTDLDGAPPANYTSRLTVVVQSEFGRELPENSDSGTEHGYGNLMAVLSGNAIGGLHGTWPGLDPGQLVDGTDLAATTDFRRILSEVLIRRLCNPQLGAIFPGYTGYEPLGIVQGADLPPVYENEIFSDGFESGDTSRWSSSQTG